MNIIRAISIMIGLTVFSLVAVPMIPTPASAWHQKEFSGSRTAAELVLVLNEDQFKGKWKQFKGELKKKWSDFTDDDLLYIEGRQDKLDGNIQERDGDRTVEVKKWVDEWFEQNKTSQNMKP